MESIFIAAKKNNRKVALVGRSMKKTIEAAIDNNIITGVMFPDEFDKYIENFNNQNVKITNSNDYFYLDEL